MEYQKLPPSATISEQNYGQLYLKQSTRDTVRVP